MLTKSFWLDALERAVKTFAQAMVAILTIGTPIYDVDWVQGLGIAATATVVSLLTSLASTSAGAPGTASLVGAGAPPATHRKE